MKRLTCLAIALLIAFSLTACGNQEAIVGGAGSKPNPQPTAPQEGNQTLPSTQPADMTGKTIKVPSKQIYFTANTDWDVEKENLSTLIYDSSACLVSICYSWSSEFDGNYEGLIESLGLNFIKDAANESQGNITHSKIEVLTTEQTTVAGYESVKFTGKVNNDGNWDCHVYGYVYVVDGVKLMVIGIVSAPEQDATIIAEIDALTAQVAASVYTKE